MSDACWSGLRLGHSCHRFLTWEGQLARPEHSQRLLPGLCSAGYQNMSRTHLLWELRHPVGHSVLVVPKSGRIQIRVHYLTPLAERRGEADTVAQEIERSLARGPSVSDGWDVRKSAAPTSRPFRAG